MIRHWATGISIGLLCTSCIKKEPLPAPRAYHAQPAATTDDAPDESAQTANKPANAAATTPADKPDVKNAPRATVINMRSPIKETPVTPTVALGKATIDCTRPDCLTVSGLPALSRKTGKVAFLALYPGVLYEGGGATDVECSRFDMIDLSTGKLAKKLDLITMDEHNIPNTTLKNCCGNGREECDPGLCRPDPRKVKKAKIAFKRDISKRINTIATAIEATSWTALKGVPPEARPDHRFYFEEKTTNDAVEITLFEAKSKHVYAKRSISYKCNSTDACEQYGSATVWTDANQRVAIMQVLGAQSGTDNWSVNYAVQKLPTGVIKVKRVP